MNKRKLYKDRDWLEEQYVEKGKSMREIGEIFDITGDAIGRWIQKFNISTRKASDYIKDGRFRDEDWLREKYLEEGLSTRAIAKLEDCSSFTIRKYLHKFDISVRNIGQAPDKKLYKNKQWLEKKFNEENLSSDEIAQQANCSSSTIQKYLHKLDIKKPSKKWIRITCDYCDRKFQRVKNKIKSSHNFCSPECANNAQKTGQRTVKCSYCDKEIKRWPYQIKQQDRFFCSTECESKWNSKHLNGKNHPNYTGEVTVNCSECDTPIKVYPYRLNNTQHFFCSEKCKSKWLSKHFENSDNPNWKGGFYPYYGSNWRKQRRKALKRDNYTCQLCGTQNEERELDVHHIKPVREFILQDNRSWDEINDLSNLVSLCNSCHKKAEQMNKEILLKEIGREGVKKI